MAAAEPPKDEPSSPAAAAADDDAPPMSPGILKTMAPPAETSLHRGVERATHMLWDSRPDDAMRLLSLKKDESPRNAVEYAFAHLISGVLSSNNEQREACLSHFQVADNMATAQRYSTTPTIQEDVSDPEILEAALADQASLSKDELEKVRKLQEKQREKDKEAYKKQQAVAGAKDFAVAWKAECDVIYADALLVRSLVQLTMNSYLKGGVNLRKTWGCYYALMQEVEKDQAGPKQIPEEVVMNIKFGCGVFYCYLALVPAGLMKLLSAIGFISDKELGEAYLTEVFQNDRSIRAPFAALVLCTYYLFLPTGLGDVTKTLAKAKIILDTMCERYPNNSHFWAYKNFYHRKRGECGPAVDAIQRATANAERTGARPTLLRYLFADTMYMDLQFEVAKKKYHELLDHLAASGETFAYTGQVVLSLAACYMWTDDDAKAMEWLKKINGMYNPKSKQDSNSPKFAARVISEPKLLPLLGVYVLYINRDLAHMEQKHVERLKVCMAKAIKDKDLSAPECTAMSKLFDGVMLKALHKKESARSMLMEILGMEKKLSSTSLTLPYAYYEMGELEYRSGNLPRAKELFEKGSALKGDGHETLANRYSIAMKQLKREMKEKGLEK